VNRGLRVLTSGAAAEDAVMIRSGPLRAASATDWLGAGGRHGVQVLAAALYGCVPVIAAGVHAPDKQPEPAAGRPQNATRRPSAQAAPHHGRH
jgi:hypothetical protein